jgi:hypothetical protein
LLIQSSLRFLKQNYFQEFTSMKNFSITPSDLNFLLNQVNVPIIRIVKYLVDGTPIYGYTAPNGTEIELGIVGTASTLAASTINPSTITAGNPTGSFYTTFDPYNSSWAQYLPPVVSAAGTSPAGVGEPFGIRNVQGLFNNISLPSSATWGAAYYPFARNSAANYSSYFQQSATNSAFQLRTKASPVDQATVNALAGLTSGQTPGITPAGTPTLWSSLNNSQKALLQDSTYGVSIDSASGNVDLSQRYANPFLTVYDYSPRMISQTVDSQAALERINAAAPGTITDTQVYQITDINDPTGNTFLFGGYDAAGAPLTGGTYFKEDFSRNLNTLGGDPTLTGWQVLFGQFFDHGLDFIGKGGNTINGKSSKVYIPLAPTDPFYRAPGTNGPNDPGYTKLSISRATVDNPDAAGADGMFHTADDIQSPGTDGIYGTTDDIIGPTSPNYVNHTSPYIDQSQTYGSNDTVTDLLREWVIDPITGHYAHGMKLFDGNTLTNVWHQQNPDGTVTDTNKTLPTLNELRAYLLATGRDDLSWEDISDLRVRDTSGHVLDIDSNTSGLQTTSSGHTLIADFLPRLDAAHINAAGLISSRDECP